MRLFLADSTPDRYHQASTMPYLRASRPTNAVPDSVAWKALGLSRATFFRKLKGGALTAPIARAGTSRRWWTPADLEMARLELDEAKGKEGRD